MKSEAKKSALISSTAACALSRAVRISSFQSSPGSAGPC
jgi:hypothetical protein